MKLKIYDIAKVLFDHPDGNPDLRSGDIGTVCYVSGSIYGVRFDRKIRYGHDCNKSCENEHGWLFTSSEIELYEDDPDGTNDIDEASFIALLEA